MPLQNSRRHRRSDGAKYPRIIIYILGVHLYASEEASRPEDCSHTITARVRLQAAETQLRVPARRDSGPLIVAAARVSDEALRTTLRKHAIASQNAQRLTAMVRLAQSEEEVVLAVEKIDADPYLLGVKNGIVDLRTGKFRSATRDDCVTKRAGVAFDPAARCPNWIAFLDKIFAKDHALIEYIQRATGYVLTGLTDEEVMFVLWGEGDNGKSTFRETIFALLGDYAVGADASMLITTKNVGGATPDLARLHGRTINETQQKTSSTRRE
jgi:putative DNA primase/helicase